MDRRHRVSEWVSPGFRLKLMVTDGNWPWWFTDSGRHLVMQCHQFAQRHHPGGLGCDVDPLQERWGPSCRSGAASRMTKYGWAGVELRDWTLPEGIIQYPRRWPRA